MTDEHKTARVAYGYKHKDDTLEKFWAFVHWTDEAHGDLKAQGTGQILREEGTAYHPENLQPFEDLEGCTVHVAASVSYHHKSELTFYNDENDNAVNQVQKPKKPRKPVKRKRENDEMYERRLVEWEASLPHDVEVKPKVNSMTQQYYRDKILPIWLREIEKQRALGRPVILQEDNNPSHGTIPNKRRKVPNVAAQFKQEHHIRTLTHPASSPDLNPKT